MQVTWLFRESYTEDEVHRYAPADAGIYLLWVKLKSHKWRCFYVGQTKDLETRLLEHLSSGEENACVRTNVTKYTCGFECATVSTQADRDGAEKFLYDHYEPECNVQDPGGTPIPVNLPS